MVKRIDPSVRAEVPDSLELDSHEPDSIEPDSIEPGLL
jgi:hypothetical protein